MKGLEYRYGFMRPQVLFCTFVLVLYTFAALVSCKKKTDSNVVQPVDTLYTLTPDTLLYPPHFPLPLIPEDNKPYKELIQLGRMLYYDTMLSNDGRACASCHIQANGFTTAALYNNVMPVLPHEHLAWYTNFMWDGSKTGTLEDVMLFEVKDFFGTDLNKINQSSKWNFYIKESLFKLIAEGKGIPEAK
jgi:cytochrome c peroxidase